MSVKLYATFYVDDMLFGVDAIDVQEILLPQRLTTVPLASQEIDGLINLRGQVVVVIDLRKQLGLPARETTNGSVNIVLRTEYGPVSIVVDEVGDVLEADDSDMETPPSTISAPTRDLITAVQKLDERLLLILDVKQASSPVPV